MAKEKGATATDKAAHLFYDNINAYHPHITNYGNFCRRCGGKLDTAYHEERLYSVHCQKCGTVTLVKTNSPGMAERYAENPQLVEPQDLPLAENTEQKLQAALVAAVPAIVQAIVENMPKLVEAYITARAADPNKEG